MRSSVLRAVLFGIFITILGDSVDLTLHWVGATTWYVEVITGDILTGIIAAVLVFGYLEERRRRNEQRIEELGFLNHNIRNALTAIKLAPYAESEDLRLRMIHDATDRIERTLRKMGQQEHVTPDTSLSD